MRRPGSEPATPDQVQLTDGKTSKDNRFDGSQQGPGSEPITPDQVPGGQKRVSKVARFDVEQGQPADGLDMGTAGSAATTEKSRKGRAGTAATFVTSSSESTKNEGRADTRATFGTAGTEQPGIEEQPKSPHHRRSRISRASRPDYERNVTAQSCYSLSENFAVSWKDLGFTAHTKQGEKIILHKQSGHLLPGHMVALMGPSGSGKTTLLDLLADRVKRGGEKDKRGQRHGEVLIGNQPRVHESSRKIVSYVSSEDSLLSCFTVRETLDYTAMFLCPHMGKYEREERVDGVLITMGLEGCADSRVGDAIMKGISNGQKRRLSIAMGKLSRAPVLLLDEPTSGLDADAAYQVVKYMKGAAQKMHTVAMSIHQPNSKTFNLFSVVCILAKGRQIYLGPVRDALEYFESVGHRCPSHTNPADFYIEVVDTDFGANTDESLVDLADMYLGSEVSKAYLSQEVKTMDAAEYAKTVKEATYFEQFQAILLRMLHMNVKNPYIWGVRVVAYICLTLVVGTMYLGVGHDATCDVNDPSCICDEDVLRDAQSLLPYLFSVPAFLVNMSVAVLPFFLEIRDVFRRERSNGHIACFPYVVADFFANLPGITIIATSSSAIVVFLPGMNNFGGFFLNLWLSLIVAESFMRFVGAGQPHYIIGMASACGLFGMFMFVEGFMIRPQDIPDYWIWAHKIAFHTYSFEWFMHNQFSGDAGAPCGEAILKEYSMNNVDPMIDILFLVGCAVLFQVCFFCVLFIIHTGRR